MRAPTFTRLTRSPFFLLIAISCLILLLACSLPSTFAQSEAEALEELKEDAAKEAKKPAPAAEASTATTTSAPATPPTATQATEESKTAAEIDAELTEKEADESKEEQKVEKDREEIAELKKEKDAAEKKGKDTKQEEEADKQKEGEEGTPAAASATSNCPRGCSIHGKCQKPDGMTEFVCVCDVGYESNDCSVASGEVDPSKNSPWGLFFIVVCLAGLAVMVYRFGKKYCGGGDKREGFSQVHGLDDAMDIEEFGDERANERL